MRYRAAFSSVQTYLASEEKANELLEFMKKKRKVETKVTLKRGYLMN